MQIFNDIIYWSNVLLYVTIGIAFLIGVCLFYFLKIKKPKKDTEHDEKYTKFKREDSKTYVPIDDTEEDMIITDNGTRFIGGIICSGFDYYSANIEERFSTNKGYLGFINVIDKPIQKRIFCKSVDLEDNILSHKKIYHNLEKELERMYREILSIQKSLKDLDENKNSKEILLYQSELLKLSNSISSTEWQLSHINHIIVYLIEISGVNTNPVREDTYLFDWVFNPKAFPEDITDQEIRERANNELSSKARQFAHALSSCNVKVKRATTKELEEMIRRHYQPYGSGVFKERDIENSNVYEPIVSSNSLVELEKLYKQSISNELLERMKQVQLEKVGA